jgi:hypothetical protein
MDHETTRDRDRRLTLHLAGLLTYMVFLVCLLALLVEAMR